MKFTVLCVWCALLSFSASAQWSVLKQLPLLNRHQQLPELPAARGIAFKMPRVKEKPRKLTNAAVSPSDYTLELAEAEIMKTAQHHMRFRMYETASHDFNSLAHLYLQQNRFSEAKWFFLQSTIISREQNNNRLTIANLMQLANIKAAIGDFVLAQQDLLEAREIASTKGYLSDLLEVEKNLNAIQRSRFVSARTDFRYDDRLKEVAMAN